MRIMRRLTLLPLVLWVLCPPLIEALVVGIRGANNNINHINDLSNNINNNINKGVQVEGYTPPQDNNGNIPGSNFFRSNRIDIPPEHMNLNTHNDNNYEIKNDYPYNNHMVNETYTKKNSSKIKEESLGLNQITVDRNLVSYLCNLFERQSEEVPGQSLTRNYWCPRPHDVNFYLYTRSNHGAPERLVADDLAGVESSSFDASHETIVIIHGFMPLDPWEHQLRAALLAKDDYNVVVVDWRNLTRLTVIPYVHDAQNIVFVAKQITHLINTLKGSRKALRLDKLQLVGHSLGAQTSALVGRALGGAVARIYGLDPAGPMFEGQTGEEGRLDRSDAKFVYVIHTDMKLFGYAGRLGHVDVYPNGGLHQCLTYMPGLCDLTSHSLAHQYFIESVHRRALAYPCNPDGGYAAFKRGKCLDSPQVFGFNTASSTSGVYFMDTEVDAEEDHLSRTFLCSVDVASGKPFVGGLRLKLLTASTALTSSTGRRALKAPVSKTLTLISPNEVLRDSGPVQTVFGMPLSMPFEEVVAAQFAIRFDSTLDEKRSPYGRVLHVARLTITAVEDPSQVASVCGLVALDGVTRRFALTGGTC